MGKELERRFKQALRLVSLSELTRGTTRSRSAWEKYSLGSRRPTVGAAKDLAKYLRSRAQSYAQAADALEAAAEREERGDG
jgi:hypothetical protein